MLRLFVRFGLVLALCEIVLNPQVGGAWPSNMISCATINGSISRGKGVTYRTYTNARYGYSIVYPVGLLEPQGEAENGDGQKFLSKDKKVLLLVFGANNIDNDSAKTGFDKFVKDMNAEQGRVVTYKVLKKNWFVASGRHDNNLFYSKTIYRGDTFTSFIIEYPASERATYDPIVTRISRSFTG